MLSPNFNQSEFEIDAPVPDDCVAVLTEFCTLILEPVREKFGRMKITSGYRTPAANAAAHGISDSEHIYSSTWCAGDIEFLDAAPRDAFDWMRNNPVLPFHQLILEHGADGSSVVHVSRNRQKEGVRSVLEGATHNAEPYVAVDHVSYNPTISPMGVDESTQV